MPKPSPSPVAPDERLLNLDVLRALALFGVLLVNLLTEFRVSVFAQFFGPTAGTPLDHAIERFVSVAIEFKAFILFSILFGVGLAIQWERSQRGARAFHGHIARRLGSLLVIGLVHLLLIWNGDILTEYAVVGFLSLPLLRLRRALLPVASLLFLIFVLPLPYPSSFPSDEAMHAHIALANSIYAHGSAAAVEVFRLREIPPILALLLRVLPRTLALFAFGIWAFRARVFTPSGANFKLWRRAAIVCLLGGGSATLLTAGVFGQVSLGPFDSFVSHGAEVALAIGYGALVLMSCARPGGRRVLGLLAPLGRMALTNYLTQSLIFGVVFYGYGFGQFGAMSEQHAALLGIAVYAGQAVASAFWLRRFRFGPVEWLWRSATYAAWQPLRV